MSFFSYEKIYMFYLNNPHQFKLIGPWNIEYSKLKFHIREDKCIQATKQDEETSTELTVAVKNIGCSVVREDHEPRDTCDDTTLVTRL